MTAYVLRADAAHLPLPDASVDLVVTSPPYFGLRSYTDAGEHYTGQVGDEPTPAEYLTSLLTCTAEWLRVLKPAGSLFVNLGDKYAERSGPDRRGGVDDDATVRRPARRPPRGRRDVRVKSLHGLPWRYALGCIDTLGLILRSEIIWQKPNALPESVTDRVRRSHEQVFHFTKWPRYFSNLDAIREDYAPGTAARYARGFQDSGQALVAAQLTKRTDYNIDGMTTNPRGRLPGSVWSIPTRPLRVPEELGVSHFAAYPPELVRRIVLGWSPEHGTVLDPFGGTGTTALVASVYGRTGISVDLSHDYSRLAAWRTQDEKQRIRTAALSDPKPSKAAPTERTNHAQR